MNVLSIGTDKNILNFGSRTVKRQIEYGKLFNELHVVVFSKRGSAIDDSRMAIGENVFAYPTKSKSSLFYVRDALKIAKNIIKNNKIDIVTTEDPFLTGLTGYVLKKKFGVRLHIQIHTDLFSPYFRKIFWRNKIYFWIARRVIKNADRIRVVSRNIKNSLVEKWRIQGEKIDVLPISFDIKEFNQQKTSDEVKEKYKDFFPRLLIVSRLTKEKNIEFAVRMVPSILKNYPKAILIVVGDGPERKKLESLTTKIGVAESVSFVGAAPELINYYKTADVLIFPSFYEGFGLVVLEASASGLPVIMSKVGAINDIFFDKQNVIVFDVNDASGFMCSLDAILRDQQLRNRLINNARETIDAFYGKDEYLRLYQKSLGGTIKDSF